MDGYDMLDHCPLITVEEAAPIMEVDVRTARRRFNALRGSGLATYRVVGRGGHREQRWVLTPVGVEKRYDDSPPWWHMESGQRVLLRRVEMLRGLYRALPMVFKGLGVEWYQGAETPRLLRCTLIRGPRGRQAKQEAGLIQAVLEYTNGFNIFVCWVGNQVRVPQMLEKWKVRFSGLRTHTLDEFLDQGRTSFDQIDPNFDWDPRPSGYLVLAPDWWAANSADKNLPREGYRGAVQPFLFIDVSDMRGFSVGTVEPRPHDWIDNPPEFRRWRAGRIPRFLRPDAPPEAADLLGMAVPAATLDLVSGWSGLRRQDLARRLARSKGDVIDPVVDEMIAGKWLQEVNGMLYPAGTGILHVARRDRVSADTVRGRVAAAIKLDHLPVGSHRRHTIAVNQVMIRLHESGMTPWEGWRAVENVGSTQLAPDLVIFAVTLLGRGVYPIEVERTAVHPEQVADKLHPWSVAAEEGSPRPVIFIVENPEVEVLFQTLGAGLPLLTSTLREVRRGPLQGDHTVWRFRGQPVAMYSGGSGLSKNEGGFPSLHGARTGDEA